MAESKKRKLDDGYDAGDADAVHMNASSIVAAVSEGAGGSHEFSAIDVEKAKFVVSALPADKLNDIALKAVDAFPHLLEFLKDACSLEITTRKLFIRGLTWETTSDDVRAAFSKYGTIVDCSVVMDKNTGYSKGFGFLTFVDIDSTYAALADPSKQIKGQTVHCNMAAKKDAKAERGPSRSEESKNRKLFVRGIGWECTTEQLQRAFEPYGPVVECFIASDRATGKTKGYGFVTMETDEQAAKVVSIPSHIVEGRSCVATIAAAGGERAKKPQANYAAAGYGAYGAAAGGYGAYGAYGGAAGYGYGAAGAMGGYDYSGYAAAGYADPSAYGYDTSGYYPGAGGAGST